MRRLISKYRLVLAPALMVAIGVGFGLATTVEAQRNPSPDATSGTSNLSAHQVQVRDFNYSPAQVTNLVNDPISITVTNAGPSPHTFTIDGMADSGSIPSGQSRTVQFTPSQAGNLTFYCTIHGRGTMSGTISVMNPATNPVQPSQQPTQPPSVQQPPIQQPAPPPARPQVIMSPPSTGDGGLLSALIQ
jgi:plastocyanin